MTYTFVLKDKGTSNQGWWLKLSSIDELMDYTEQTNPEKYGKLFEDYLRGRKLYDHASAFFEGIEMQAKEGQNIIEAMNDFALADLQRRMDTISEYGCIFVNRLGAYHADYDGKHKYDFVHSKKLIFPDFKREDIRIKKFDNGTHYYAYIDYAQVRDGDTLKWNSYDEALKHALSYLCD